MLFTDPDDVRILTGIATSLYSSVSTLTRLDWLWKCGLASRFTVDKNITHLTCALVRNFSVPQSTVKRKLFPRHMSARSPTINLPWTKKSSKLRGKDRRL